MSKSPWPAVSCTCRLTFSPSTSTLHDTREAPRSYYGTINSQQVLCPQHSRREGVQLSLTVLASPHQARLACSAVTHQHDFRHDQTGKFVTTRLSSPYKYPISLLEAELVTSNKTALLTALQCLIKPRLRVS